MMDEFRWIQMFLFVILELQITVMTEGEFSSITVRSGHDATLPCRYVITNQDKCDNIDWIVINSRNTEDLVKRGKVHKNIKIASDRLSVTANCSLVIKKVTGEDVGVFHCQHRQSGHDTQVDLSVVNMNKQEDSEQVTLSCSCVTHDPCRHTVKWLHDGKDVEDEASRACSDAVRLKPSSDIELFQCKVTDGYSREEKLFTFSPQSSVKDTTTVKTTESSKSTKTYSTAISVTPTTPEVWWWYIVIAVGLAALVIIIVVVLRWKKTKGSETQTYEEVGLNLNPAVTRSPDTVDPEDGVSYASISFTRRTSSKAPVQVKDGADDYEGGAVTYSTVKASSSSDHSSLYRPNK
ncbi:hypothetical protein PAMA_007288 [Pampus argenteus]